MTGYINALTLRFEDKDAGDEAYSELEKVRYEGCIQDMFTQIQTHNDKAMVTGAALKKLILERLPQKILDQMHTVDQTGKTDQEIISVITNAGRTLEKWDTAQKNLGLKAQFKIKEQGRQSFRKRGREEPSKDERRRGRKSNDRSERKKFKRDRSERKARRDYAKTEGIDPSEIERRKAVGECLRCAWPSDSKGNHRVKDCVRPIKLDKGTATYPKAKEYQKMKIAGMLLLETESEESEESDQEEGNSESDESKEEESSVELEGSEEEDWNEPNELEVLEEEEGNWWDSPPPSD
jgi:hypothetical protein